MRILMANDYTHPCDEPFMSEVYGRRFRERGHEMVWLMRAPRPDMAGETASWYGSPVHLVPGLAAAGAAGLARDVAAQLRAGRLIERLMDENDFDLVYAWDDVLIGNLCLRAARARGMPFVYQLSFLKAEEQLAAPRAGGRGRGRLLANYAKGWGGYLLRSRILREADLILPISQAMAGYLGARGIDPSRLVPVPMGADTSIDPDAVDGGPVRERYGLEGPVLIYLGTMSRFRRLEFLFPVIRLVREQAPGTKLLMVGDGPDPADVERLADQAAAAGVGEWVVFTGRVPRSEVPLYLRAADVGLSPIPPNPVLDKGSPTKVLEYMAMRLPVVGNDIEDQASVLGQSEGGVCVPYEPEAFARAVVELLRDPGTRRLMGERGRRWVVENRSYDRLADVVEGAFLRLLAERGGKHR